MRVEVLYVPDCPSHPAAVRLVRDVLAAEGVAADVREILVEDERMATELKFAGSPTIRINGREVAGGAQTPERFALLPCISGIEANRSPASGIGSSRRTGSPA